MMPPVTSCPSTVRDEGVVVLLVGARRPTARIGTSPYAGSFCASAQPAKRPCRSWLSPSRPLPVGASLLAGSVDVGHDFPAVATLAVDLRAQRDLVVHPNLLDDPALLVEELGHREDPGQLFVSGPKYGAPP